jgi:hypothetical protein
MIEQAARAAPMPVTAAPVIVGFVPKIAVCE